MQTVRSILSILVLIVFVTVGSGVPTWSAPCCQEEMMECCEEAGADVAMPPCCEPVVIVHALQLEAALATLPSLPVPCFTALLHPIRIEVLPAISDAGIMPTGRNDRSGPLIPPPLTLIESFLI